MPPNDAVQSILSLYPRIYFACHTRHVRDEPSGQTLSRHQASILSHLDEVEPTSLSELAGHMGVTVSTMSLSIKRLQRQGFVRRRRDRKDGRVVQLRLTDAGVRVRDAQSVLDEDRVAAMLGLLDDAERAAALEGLGLLARAAGELMRAQAGAVRGEDAPRTAP